MTGPLAGLKIIEFAGIGPGPFAGMMLADHGAEVIRLERTREGRDEPEPGAAKDFMLRSRKIMAVDLKSPDGIEIVRDLVRSANGIIEGFRPGVMERLGLGPDILLSDNPRLVYGRMTGWGQSGPYAAYPGHDINYIALAGVLNAFGRAGQKPTPPLNMVGDFGGGGMMLAFGMVSALFHAQKTGEGQVIDCAMTDGAAVLMTMIWSLRAQGIWQDQRGVNALDTGAHFYDSYETSDGKFIALGSIEPQFYSALLDATGLSDDPEFAQQMNPARWSALKLRLATIIAEKSRDEWTAIMEERSICFAPVLNFDEAPLHPHNVARGTFVEVAGKFQPAPAPRYSKTQTDVPRMPQAAPDAFAILQAANCDPDRVRGLLDKGVIA